MKKLAVLFLALALMMTSVLVPILADGDTVTTVGYSSARVKKADLTNVANIKDYDEGNRQYAYKITDPEGLVKLSTLVNTGVDSFEKVYIYLAKDLDMSGVTDFEPIGRYGFTITGMAPDSRSDGSWGGVETISWNADENFPFKGNFNGHGHLIENLVMNIDGKEFVFGGLFGYINNAIISNLILGENCEITYSPWNNYGASGSIVGKAMGVKTVLDNIYNLADVNANAFEKLAENSQHSFGAHAAMIGRGFATITNCTNAGDMNGSNSASGFIGYAEGQVNIKNCRNTGTITGLRAGGIAARSSGPLNIENCINNGEIYGTGWVGGILGQVNNATTPVVIKNCTNYGAFAAFPGKEGSAQISTDGIAFCLESNLAAYTSEGNVSNVGETDATLATDLETPVFDDLEDTTGSETAFTTAETLASTEEYIIPNNPNPTGNEVGYSSARVEAVDTSSILNIKNYWDTDDILEAYKITDVEGWYYLDELLYEYNIFTDVTIYLANDLNFENKEGYEPISFDDESFYHINEASTYYFGGILDGLGHQICNLNMVSEFEGHKVVPGTENPNAESVAVSALFGYTAGATFKNLIIDDSCSFKIRSTAANPINAALCGRAVNITVDNVWNQAELSGGRFAGSLVARTGWNSFETISNVTNSGDITASQCVGGLIGYADGGSNDTTVTNCRNVGHIKHVGTLADTQGAGGFIGRCLGVTSITGSINNGDITSSGNIGAFISIAGANITIVGSTNYGLLDDYEGAERTGFVAWLQPNIAATLQISIDETSTDKYGQIDTSLTLELELPTDFTPNVGNPVIPSQTTTAAGTTQQPVSTTVATTKAATKANTKGSTLASNEEEEGGCASTVVGGFAVIVLLSGAALTLCKKKRK